VLPDFPPKRFFKNSDDTIKERKELFENYLNFLFRNVNICSHAEIIDFLEMEKELLTLLMKSNTMIESSSSTAIKRYYSMKKGSEISSNMVKKCRSVDDTNLNSLKASDNYYSSFLEYKLNQEKTNSEKSANMLVVEEFLRNLEFKFENKYDIIKTFEQFLKSKKNWPSFKRDEISKLFYGDIITYSSNISANSLSSESSNASRTYLKGLMYHIGNIEQNNLGAQTCLEFLGKLIDYEFNPECEAYIFVLKTSKIEYLHSMKINEHIKNNKISIVTICYRLLKAIVNEDKSMESKLKKLVNDEEIIEKFLFWLENNN